MPVLCDKKSQKLQISGVLVKLQRQETYFWKYRHISLYCWICSDVLVDVAIYLTFDKVRNFQSYRSLQSYLKVTAIILSHSNSWESYKMVILHRYQQQIMSLLEIQKLYGSGWTSVVRSQLKDLMFFPLLKKIYDLFCLDWCHSSVHNCNPALHCHWLTVLILLCCGVVISFVAYKYTYFL